MAVYVTATKIEDNEEYVLYKYGFNPDSLVGSFSINKDLTHWKLINDAGIRVYGKIAAQSRADSGFHANRERDCNDLTPCSFSICILKWGYNHLVPSFCRQNANKVYASNNRRISSSL